VYAAWPFAEGFGVGVFGAFAPPVPLGSLGGAPFLLVLITHFVLWPLVPALAQPRGRPAPPHAPRLRPSVAVTTVIALLLASHVAVAQEPAQELLLKDQFGRVDGPGRHRGQAVLLLYGKGAGLRRMKAWELTIREHVPGAL